MKLSVLALALVACGDPPRAPPPTPPILADPTGPLMELRLCGGPALALADDCRSDGSGDLDGDGAIDCWRAGRANVDELGVWVWRGCAGAPVILGIPRWSWMEVTLPVELAGAARGLAQVLAGEGQVACQKPAPGCAAAGPELAWWLELRDHQRLHAPEWQAGPPGPTPAGALVLDPSALVVHRAGEALKHVVTCDAWEVFLSGSEVAVVDRATRRWRRFHEPRTDFHGFHGFSEAVCAGELVLLPHGTGVDTLAIAAIHPRTGRWDELALDAYEWKPMVERGVLRTGRGFVSLRQLGAILGDVSAAGPCPEGPLLASASACRRAGKQDIDGDGRDDCWQVTRTGNPEAGILSVGLSIDRGCVGDPREETAATDGVVNLLELPKDTADATVRWMARELAGAEVGCRPKARRDCPSAGPAVVWLHDRLQGRSRTRPIWQEGTPRLPPPSATLVPGALLIHNPVAEPVRGAGLAASGSCERFEVWTGPAGGAVVDKRSGRWAWAYLASDSTAGSWPAAVGRGWCQGEVVYLELPSVEQIVVARPLSGDWRVVPRAEVRP